jgi:integrase
MGRKAAWPPKVGQDRGWDRVRWRGVHYRLGKTGSPEAAAAYHALLLRLEAAEKAKEAAQHPAPFSGSTVAEAVAAWSAGELPSLPQKEGWLYARALTVLVRVHGTLPSADFGPQQLEDVRDAMASGSWLHPHEKGRQGLSAAKGGRGTKRAGPWCRSVCNRQVGRIKTVWRWVERRGMCPRGSWAGLRSLPSLKQGGRSQAKESPRRPDLSHADIVRVALAIKRGCARRMLLVQLWSGCRSGEVRGMLWSEINRTGPVWVWKPAKHKLAHKNIVRQIALGPKAQAVLLQQRRKAPTGDLVFPCRGSGLEHTASVYGHTCARAARKVGIPRFKPYFCRHSCRDRITAALGIEHARAVLGHGQASMTGMYGLAGDLKAASEAARKAG